MKKLLPTAVVAAMLSNLSVAGEVGAPYPQLDSQRSAPVVVAIAETGASNRWTTEPYTNMITARQTAKLNAHVEGINAAITSDLDAYIAETIEQSISQVSTDRMLVTMQ